LNTSELLTTFELLIHTATHQETPKSISKEVHAVKIHPKPLYGTGSSITML